MRRNGGGGSAAVSRAVGLVVLIDLTVLFAAGIGLLVVRLVGSV